MSRSEAAIFTNMCMIERDDGRVLVQDRRDPNWTGLTFPGGHVELGESFHDSVIREVREESGLLIRNPILCGVKHFQTKQNERYLVLCYHCRDFNGELAPSNEGDVYWMEIESLKVATLTPDFLEMLELFLKPNISEFFYTKDPDNTENWCINLY